MSNDISPELAEALTKMAKAAARMYGAQEPEYIVICRGDKSMPEEQKENPRDTQFQGFAELLWEEIDDIYDGFSSGEEFEQKARMLIAKRAYDLVQHAVGYSLEYLHECGVELSSGMPKRILPSIPDITEWRRWGYPE